MNKVSVQEAVQQIFRTLLRDPGIVLKPDMETGDLDGWDSFANVEILLACEEHWGIYFAASEIDRIRSIADLLNSIHAKLV